MCQFVAKYHSIVQIDSWETISRVHIIFLYSPVLIITGRCVTGITPSETVYEPMEKSSGKFVTESRHSDQQIRKFPARST